MANSNILGIVLNKTKSLLGKSYEYGNQLYYYDMKNQKSNNKKGKFKKLLKLVKKDFV